MVQQSSFQMPWKFISRDFLPALIKIELGKSGSILFSVRIVLTLGFGRNEKWEQILWDTLFAEQCVFVCAFKISR